MSYASIHGWTLEDEFDETSKEKLIRILNDNTVANNVRVITLIIALRYELVGISKAEQILQECSLLTDDQMYKAYEDLGSIYKNYSLKRE